MMIISAIGLAGSAAFFSIFGLSKLFIGASMSVIIMASSIEFSKIVFTSFLYQYWNKIGKAFKVVLISGIIFVMIITSMGIYGFLSSAYSETSMKLSKVQGQIELIEKKKEIKQQSIDRFKEQINQKIDRLKSISQIRSKQENRLDNLYTDKNFWVAKRNEDNTKRTNEDERTVTTEINNLNDNIVKVNNEIGELDAKILELKTQDTGGDAGPLVYISKILGISIDKLVNYLILLIIVVFDPLAIAMVVCINIVIGNGNETVENKVKKLNKFWSFKNQKKSPIIEEQNVKEDISTSENVSKNEIEPQNKDIKIDIDIKVDDEIIEYEGLKNDFVGLNEEKFEKTNEIEGSQLNIIDYLEENISEIEEDNFNLKNENKINTVEEDIIYEIEKPKEVEIIIPYSEYKDTDKNKNTILYNDLSDPSKEESTQIVELKTEETLELDELPQEDVLLKHKKFFESQEFNDYINQPIPVDNNQLDSNDQNKYEYSDENYFVDEYNYENNNQLEEEMNNQFEEIEENQHEDYTQTIKDIESLLIEDIKNPIKYETNDSGDFIKVDDMSIPEKLSKKKFKLDKQKKLYSSLLSVLFKNGNKKQGENIQDYSEFKNDILLNKIECSEKEISEFLVICNFLKIISTDNNIGIFMKNYNKAQEIIETFGN